MLSDARAITKRYSFFVARMERLVIHPKYAHALSSPGWTRLEDFRVRFLSKLVKRHGAYVERSILPAPDGQAVEVFFKLYEEPLGDWRFWLRPSKARCEFKNYEIFARLGVPAADGLAWGEKRDALGRLRQSFILTRAIPQCETLLEFFQRRPSREARAQVVRQLADITRRLHEANFYGRSLVWRNILVSRSGNAGVKLFLIDCPRGGAARFGRARRRLRDLATLDKCAMQYCSRAERLKFLLAYRQQPRLDDAARAMLRGSLDYSRRRWPDEWRGR